MRGILVRCGYTCTENVPTLIGQLHNNAAHTCYCEWVLNSVCVCVVSNIRYSIFQESLFSDEVGMKPRPWNEEQAPFVLSSTYVYVFYRSVIAMLLCNQQCAGAVRIFSCLRRYRLYIDASFLVPRRAYTLWLTEGPGAVCPSQASTV